MPACIDGPASPLFTPLPLQGNADLCELAGSGVSAELIAAGPYAPSGACVCHGIPFAVDKAVLIADVPVSCAFAPASAPWLVFMHTSDIRPFRDAQGIPIQPLDGIARLGEHAADYVMCYADGSEERVTIRRRFQIGLFQLPFGWGENCFAAVLAPKCCPRPAAHEQATTEWGQSQTRAGIAGSGGGGAYWLWAWENPRPQVPLVGIRFEPVSGAVLVSAVSAGQVVSSPLRWEARRKAILTLPEGERFYPALDHNGLLAQIQLDLGQVISACPRPRYPQETWEATIHDCPPQLSDREILIEYTAHPQAMFHCTGEQPIPAAELTEHGSAGPLCVVTPARQSVVIRTVARDSGLPVPVRLHLHGEAGEYLPPIDRPRLPNPSFLEENGVDYVRDGVHYGTYIRGETRVNLPLGRVYLEVYKGFEMRPVRQVVEITSATSEITIELEKVLPWRERGWVSADTHVHFLSPSAALLQGACEGVNVVNVLGSQWGEMHSSVADFDGCTTWGSREAGGDGEHLVRLGSENRQNILGHISLLGYNGALIAPMCNGGPLESALGDPVDALLTEWAQQCKRQDGVVVMSHFPYPRAEHAATIISGNADAVEFMTSIDPYSLLDWYRYLNCGYLTGAVGGTDKMGAYVAVGATRTYAYLGTERAFTYDAWKEAVRQARTFATCGPLLEFSVDGHPTGTRLTLPAGGGTVEVAWSVASVVVPMTRVELIVNGEVRESRTVHPDEDAGHWSVRLERSSWLALLVRGHHPEQPEAIQAHSSPVMVAVDGTPFMSAADALTILTQIEGALAYLDTIATCTDVNAYRRMRLALTSAHRSLHNRMHTAGWAHRHTAVEDHEAHHTD